MPIIRDMAKWIRKIEHGRGVVRLTIPRDLARSRGFDEAKYIIIDDHEPGALILRRLEDGCVGFGTGEGNTSSGDR